MSRIHAPSSRRDPARHAVAWSRACWGLLAAIHAVPLLRSTATLITDGLTAAHAVPWAVLLTCFVLFTLKAAGIGLFRGRTARLVLPAVAMSFLMAHGDTAIQIAKSRPVAVVTVAIAAEATIVLTPRVRRRIGELLKDLLGISGALRPRPVPAGFASPEVQSPGPARFARTTAPPRGPPV